MNRDNQGYGMDTNTQDILDNYTAPPTICLVESVGSNLKTVAGRRWFAGVYLNVHCETVEAYKKEYVHRLPRSRSTLSQSVLLYSGW